MTKAECFARLKDLLDFHFPDKPHYSVPPNWQQSPHSDDLVQLSNQSRGTLYYDDVYHWVKHDWLPSRKHPVPSIDATQLEKLVDAWGEWQRAAEILGVTVPKP